MDGLSGKIVELLHGPNPPQSVHELVAQTGNTPAYVYSTISKLLSAGLITKADLPWRRGVADTGGGRPRKNSLKSISRKLGVIADEGGRDRVQALGMLLDIQDRSADQFGPPPPRDHDGMVRELKRQMEAAGRAVSDEAYDQAFGEHDILPPEAADVQEAPNVAGPAASGDSLG